MDHEKPEKPQLADLEASDVMDPKGGPTRRKDIDHVGLYNFTVEISGVQAGYFKGVDGINLE